MNTDHTTNLPSPPLPPPLPSTLSTHEIQTNVTVNPVSKVVVGCLTGPSETQLPPSTLSTHEIKKNVIVKPMNQDKIEELVLAIFEKTLSKEEIEKVFLALNKTLRLAMQSLPPTLNTHETHEIKKYEIKANVIVQEKIEEFFLAHNKTLRLETQALPSTPSTHKIKANVIVKPMSQEKIEKNEVDEFFLDLANTARKDHIDNNDIERIGLHIDKMQARGIRILNEKTFSRDTPLAIAISFRNIEILKLILTKDRAQGNDLDFTVKNNDGETALDQAARQNSFDLLKLLLDHGTSKWSEFLSGIKSPDREVLYKKIMELNPENPLDSQLLNIFQKMGDHPKIEALQLFMNLLITKEKGDHDLLKQTLKIIDISPKERSRDQEQFLAFFRNGNFSLAQSRLNPSKQIFWKMIGSVDQLKQDISLLQKLNDFDNGLQVTFKDDIRTKLLSWIVENTPTNTEDAHRMISQVQCLLPLYVGNPEALLKEAANSEWRGKSVREHLEKTLLPSPSKPASDPSQVTALSIALARVLLIPGGGINTGIVGDVQAILNKQWPLEPFKKETIIRILHTITSHPEFSERLSQLTCPPNNSRQATLIRQLLPLKKDQSISLYDAQVSILSALLWPLRQMKNVGSCFATSVAIQLASNADGLKQLLEDYLSLVGNGCLTRKSPEANTGTIDYPLVMFSENSLRKIENDNLLTRAHELTLACLEGSGSSGSPATTVLSRISSMLTTNLGKNFDFYLWQGLNNQSKAMSLAMFNLEIDNFELYTLEGHKFLEMKDQEARDFFTELVTRVEKDNIERNKEENLEALEPLKEFLKTEEFSKWWSSLQKEIEGSKFKKGASGYGVVSNYHSTNIPREISGSKTYIPTENLSDVLGELFNWIKNLSAEEQDYIRENPGLLLVVYVKDHAMNLRAHELLTIYDKAKGNLETIQESMKKAKAASQVSLTKEIFKEFLEKFYGSITLERIDAVWSNLPNRPNPTIQGVHDFLEIFRSDSDSEEAWTQRFENTIRSINRIKDYFPDVYYLFDTNWDGTPYVGYTRSIFDEQTKVTTIFQGPVPAILSSIWEEGLTIPKFYDTSRSPLSRAYYQPKQ